MDEMVNTLVSIRDSFKYVYEPESRKNMKYLPPLRLRSSYFLLRLETNLKESFLLLCRWTSLRGEEWWPSSSEDGLWMRRKEGSVQLKIGATHKRSSNQPAPGNFTRLHNDHRDFSLRDASSRVRFGPTHCSISPETDVVKAHSVH